MKANKENPYKEIVLRGLKKLKIRKYQQIFLQDKSRRRIVLKSRQVGFSYVCALEGLVEALLDGKNQLFAAASERQSKIMIAYARKFLEDTFEIEPIRASDEKIVLPNGAELIALPKNWHTVQGFNGSIYFDEFAWNQDDDKIWKAMVPSASEVRGRITVLSTPFAKQGKFYDLWTKNEKYNHHEIDIYRALKEGKSTGEFETADEYIQDLKDDLDDPEFFPSAYECQFIDDTNSYIPLSLIEKVQSLLPNEDNNQTLWLGIDIGRLHDTTEITAVGYNKQGKREVRFIITLDKVTFKIQKKIIANLFKKHHIEKCFIDRTGIGLNLYEDLQGMFYSKVVGVHFTSKNKERMAKNLKRAIEEKDISLLKERNAALQYAAIKRTATQTGFRYDCERSKITKHADKFWSLALALESFRREKRKMKTRRYAS